ncbi:MAG: hypothetical protein ACRECV_09275 [Xanthobacteraceae bacterium]
MLIAAFLVLATAVTLGTGLAVFHLRGASARVVPWPFAGAHGLLGIAGLCCLLFSLRGPPRGVAQGVASFGAAGAVFLIVAALAGVAAMIALWRKRRAGALIALHATLAVFGFVLVAAYLLV